MSDGTKIEWTNSTWNPIRAYVPHEFGEAPGWHCERISPGCQNCYAETINQHRFGTRLPYTRPMRDEVAILLDEKALLAPLRWRKPRRVFVCSMTDLFGEWVPDRYLAAIWMTMAQTPHITYQVLTKRPTRAKAFIEKWSDLSGESVEPKLVRGPEATRAAHPSGRGQIFADYLDALAEPTGGVPPSGAAWPTFDWMEGPRWWPTWPLPNVWVGVSVEDQQRADERIPILLETPAAVRFLSCEPLLGPVDLRVATHDSFLRVPTGGGSEYERVFWPGPRKGQRIDWVIVGGESGPGARPCDVWWIRGIVQQCQAASVPVFVKQLGARPSNGSWETEPGTGVFEPDLDDFRFRSPKGSDPSEWPEDLRVREFPGVAS